MIPDVDTVVIGAGVVGLAIGRALASRGDEVMVLERHDRIGSETSSRNSEVIHAGLYYPTGSLRARLCVQGKQMLYRFCADNAVTAHRCGKILVATTEAELPRLAAIAATAASNGVDDLERLGADDVRAMEPEVRCIAALLSPSTGIIDSHGLMVALEGHIDAAGGRIVLNTTVTNATRAPGGGFAIETAGADGTRQGVITARRIVIAAGHGSTALAARMFESAAYKPPTMYPAKGHYFTLSGPVPFRRLVYPLPTVGSLGIHFSLDIGGQAKFGPDVQWVDTLSYEFDDADGAREALFYADIRRYWPGLRDGALHQGYTGIRPKIYREGEPAADFAIHGAEAHGVPGLVALYGIESPGLTSSLAIGELVADMMAATVPA